MGGQRRGTAALRSGQRSALLNETIYDVLRQHLEAGKLPAGLIIGEAAVARAFKASRVPAGVALHRLCADGLLDSHRGRGFIVGRDAVPLRLGLDAAGLKLPASVDDPMPRNHRERIYPEVEHAVAVCLAYGRFLLNESALAAHYQVSRTVAHEVLTRLERTGIVTQDINRRWYAGPLTPDGIRHHFEMRWLLEPAALRQAFPRLRKEELSIRCNRVSLIEDGHHSAAEVENVEQDLHMHTLAHCANPLLLETVRRSQLPLLATHSTFEQFQRAEEIIHMARDHARIFEQLISADIDGAAQTLEAHLRHSLEPTIELWRQLDDLPPALRQTYLVRTD